MVANDFVLLKADGNFSPLPVATSRAAVLAAKELAADSSRGFSAGTTD